MSYYMLQLAPKDVNQGSISVGPYDTVREAIVGAEEHMTDYPDTIAAGEIYLCIDGVCTLLMYTEDGCWENAQSKPLTPERATPTTFEAYGGPLDGKIITTDEIEYRVVGGFTHAGPTLSGSYYPVLEEQQKCNDQGHPLWVWEDDG